MEERLSALLLASSGLTALVGEQITWGEREQGEGLPAVVLWVISSVPDYTNSGPSGLVRSRVQIDCWGETYASAKAVARQVLAVLSGHVSAGPPRISGIFVADHQDDRGDRASGTEDVADLTLFRTRLDLIVHHHQA